MSGALIKNIDTEKTIYSEILEILDHDSTGYIDIEDLVIFI